MVDVSIQESSLEAMVLALLDAKSVQESEVHQRVSEFGSQFFKSLTRDHFDAISKRLLERLKVELELGVAITAEEHVAWLPDRKQHIHWRRWSAYRTLLLQQNRPLKVLDKLGDATDQILDLAGDPQAVGAWQRRGLVIGEVQSGKTSTYIGVLNKAADAGYRLFILIGGHTESLRRQTQSRVDEGFVGRDSAFMSKELLHLVDQKLVGIGPIDPGLRAYGFTTISSDFSLASASAFNFEVSEDIVEPVVLVVKKNAKILENLRRWLADQAPAGGHTMPVLLMDDEADYASINTRETEDPTAVNKGIRELLELSQRSSYVGFTATPFANVLIDEGDSEDLFPRDFIYTLESPSNYVGADAIFGSHPTDPIVRPLEDVEPHIPLKHKSTLVVDSLPNSLVEAVALFIVANAIRDIRGAIDEPRSMLVNVSRLNKVQRQVHELVEEELAKFKNAIEFDSREPGASPPLEQLQKAFEKEYSDIGLTWKEILPALTSAVGSMEAVLVNSLTKSAETYAKLAAVGRTRIIATGGAVLSRGVTLNGLMISYFYQKSRASDTLMQMGRWFGYRDSYRDLCRIWIDDEVAGWFSFVAESVSELRTDLAEMRRLNLTPRDFGLKVRKHPEALLVTAANKAKSAELVEHVVSLRDKTIESSKLSVDRTQSNFDAGIALLTDAQKTGDRLLGAKGLIFRQVPKATVANFLDSFASTSTDPYFAGPDFRGAKSPFATYVRSALEEDLSLWDVAVVGGSRKSILAGGLEISRVYRSVKEESGIAQISGNRRRVAGPDDLAPLISDLGKQNLSELARPTEKQFRGQLDRPAMLLYFIDPSKREDGQPEPDATRTILAVKVAFPADPRGMEHDVRTPGGVKYLINTVLQREWLPAHVLDLQDEGIGEVDE